MMTYQELKAELDDVMAWFSGAGQDLDVDQAIKQYQKGMELVKQLEKQLKAAENKVTKVKTGA
jgi:exodeoxyribonuclease VII small subunit